MGFLVRGKIMTGSGIFLILFVLTSLLHIVLEAKGNLPGRYITKPLLMPALGLYYLSSASQANFILLGAITCGWLGDMLLMMTKPRKVSSFLKMGMLAFLFGNILYFIVFAAYIPCIFKVPVWGWFCFAIFIAAGIIGWGILVPNAGRLAPVVIAYIIVIVLMGASAVIPLGCVHPVGAATVMAGAFMFIVSDGINAYNRFISAVPLERLLTMSTYLLAQFLIVQGYLLF